MQDANLVDGLWRARDWPLHMLAGVVGSVAARPVKTGSGHSLTKLIITNEQLTPLRSHSCLPPEHGSTVDASG